jgi:hypothetical protein
MEVSGQLHAPASSPPEKEPLVPIGWEVGWGPKAGLDAVRRKIPSRYQDSEPPIIQPIAQRCTAELSRLRMKSDI